MIATPPAAGARRSSRSGRIGRYRPTPERPFPSLGWQILRLTYEALPSPANEKKPLVYTPEQARRIIEWNRLNPESGALVYGRRLHLREAKGYGKSPFAGSLDIVDLVGPVNFGGWDADGQPVGVPWGYGELPPPWIQVAAVSEAQTQNTWSAIHAMLVANDSAAAKALRIDAGLTRMFLPDVPGARLEFVTASAGSREGQRITKATLDEPQLWTPSNGGHNLADTILGNLTKMSGRAVFTGNAYIRGSDSVAERFDVDEPGVLRYARQPSEEPPESRGRLAEEGWTRERLIAGLAEVYGDAHWVDLQRVLNDAISPTGNWARARRLFFNLPSSGEADRWMPDDVWESCAGDVVLRADLPAFAHVAVDHDHRAAAVAIAQAQGDIIALRVRHFLDADLPEGEFLDLADVERYILRLHDRYPARVLSVERIGPRGRERYLSRPGPEVGYQGMFFERSAQGLRRRGLVLLDVPASQERMAPAAEALIERAIAGTLMHDGDPELSRQMARVEASEAVKGWKLSTPDDGGRIIAPKAAMLAVHRAILARKAGPRTMRNPRARR